MEMVFWHAVVAPQMTFGLLNFPSHQIGCIRLQILYDQLSKLVKILDRGIAIHHTQFSRRSGKGTSHKTTN